MPRVVGDTIQHDLEISLSSPSGMILVDADAIPTFRVLDETGTVLFTYSATTTPNVFRKSTGVYCINITYTTPGEYTIRWEFRVGGNPYTQVEGPFTIFGTTISSTSTVTSTSGTSGSPAGTGASTSTGGSSTIPASPSLCCPPSNAAPGGGFPGSGGGPPIVGTAFRVGDCLGRGDLTIFLQNTAGNSANAAEISYGLYFVDPGPPETEVLIGPPRRTPMNPAVGEYYAAVTIPGTAKQGEYRIRWRFKELSTSPVQEVVQSFTVIAETTRVIVTPYNRDEQALINSLRILLRDNNPDRNYRFRPPEHEADINGYNQVFGFIWEDYELKEYLDRALDYWNLFPPNTNFLGNLNVLLQSNPEWRGALMWGAIAHALLALSINWAHEEFSVAPDTMIRVVMPDGREADLPISELHNICHG